MNITNIIVFTLKKAVMESTLNRLRTATNKVELIMHNINKLGDNDFLNEVEDKQIEYAYFPCISVRVENILNYRKTGKYNTQHKDLMYLVRSGDSSRVANYLRSLDDVSFQYSLKNVTVGEVARTYSDISMRLKYLELNPPQIVQRDLKKIPINF